MNSATTSVEATGSGAMAFSANSYAVNSSFDWPSNKAIIDWVWDAGSSTVTNTDGSVSAQVRANQSAGFSIVKWTAGGSYGMQSVGHGLNAKPAIVINKRTDAAGGWSVFTDVIDGSYDYLSLNSTSGASSATGYYQADSSTFDLYHGHYTDNGWEFIAYCFTDVEGYSKFGSYTGNGSADGPFVYLGFRPAYILVKNSSIVDNWEIYDAARSTYNATDHALRPDTSGAEFSHASNNRSFDILSNGFKVRGNNNGINGSGNTLIYAAFAEHPFKTSRAR